MQLNQLENFSLFAQNHNWANLAILFNLLTLILIEIISKCIEQNHNSF